MPRMLMFLTGVGLLALTASCGRSPLEIVGSGAFEEARPGAGPDFVSAVYSKETNLFYLDLGEPSLEDGDVYGFLVWFAEGRGDRYYETVMLDMSHGEYGAFQPVRSFTFLGDRIDLVREDLLKAHLATQTRGAYGEGANWEGSQQVCVCDGVTFEVDVPGPDNSDDCAAAGGTTVCGGRIYIPVP